MGKFDELKRPFHPRRVSWKPGVIAKSGNKALALIYADLRAYYDRLDEVFKNDWNCEYKPLGDKGLIATVEVTWEEGEGDDTTHHYMSRSSTGEATGGGFVGAGCTVAEAQAFKRACAALGLGRYFYSFPQEWMEFDSKTRSFTPAARQKLAAMVLKHYQAYDATATVREHEVGLDNSEAIDPDGTVGDNHGELVEMGRSLGAVTGKVGEVAAQANGRSASDAQLRFLGKLSEEAGIAFERLASLLGGPVDAGQARFLFDKMSKTHKPQGSDSYVPNPGYDAAWVEGLRDEVMTREVMS